MKKTAVIIVLLSVVLILSSCITVNINSNGDQTTDAVTTAAQTEEQTTTSTTETQTDAATTAAETDVEQTEQELTAELFNSHKGYWTNEDGKFIYFGEENGAYRVSFGIWNAGGPFPSGTVTSVTKTGEKSYLLKISIDAVQGNDENGGWEAYEVTTPLTDVDGARRVMTAVYDGDTELSKFYYSEKAENPFLDGVETDAADFVINHLGYWTNDDGKYIYVGEENGEKFISFAVWNAGGPFPVGDIKTVKAFGSRTYVITVGIRGFEGNEEVGSWDPYDFDFHITDNETTDRSVTAVYPGEETESVFYYQENPFAGGMG